MHQQNHACIILPLHYQEMGTASY
uniref:Uncharacterized protein n=1 Tax=Anguilla anguilla TaxID=7936 RepID=A0A0E9RPH2_ANGAN